MALCAAIAGCAVVRRRYDTVAWVDAPLRQKTSKHMAASVLEDAHLSCTGRTAASTRARWQFHAEAFLCESGPGHGPDGFQHVGAEWAGLLA